MGLTFNCCAVEQDNISVLYLRPNTELVPPGAGGGNHERDAHTHHFQHGEEGELDLGMHPLITGDYHLQVISISTATC